MVLDGSHRRHRERGDGLARRSRSPSAARRPTPDRRPAGVAGGYGDVVVSISPGRGGGGYADVVVSSPADEASWVQQQVGSLISIWSKSSNCSVRASVCGLRGSRVVVEYELPARGPVEKEITVEKLRTLLADEQAGAAASLQTDRREEQRLRLLEEERRREGLGRRDGRLRAAVPQGAREGRVLGRGAAGDARGELIMMIARVAN